MNKPFKKYFCIGFLTVIAMLATGCTGKGKIEESQGNLLYSEIKSVNKLVLSQMAVSKLSSIDDLKLSEAQGMKQTVEALGDAVKIGSRKAAYSYSTYLRAFLDMTELSPEDVQIDEEKRIVRITLPQIHVEVQGRDPGIKEEHYRVTGLRSQINAEERASIKEKMNTAVSAEINRNPEFRNRLIAQAKSKAITFFTEIGEDNGYNVDVVFKN